MSKIHREFCLDTGVATLKFKKEIIIYYSSQKNDNNNRKEISQILDLANLDRFECTKN